MEQRFDAQQILASMQASAEAERANNPRARIPQAVKMNDGSTAAPGALVAFKIDEVGKYELSFTFARRANQFDNVSVRVQRASDGHTVAYRLFDYHSQYPAVPSAPKTPDYKAEDITRTMPIAFDTPGEYTAHIGGGYGILTSDGSGGWGARAPAPHVSQVTLKRDMMITGDVNFSPSGDFGKKYPGKTGKSANASGEYGRAYSFSFKPYREACYSNAVESVKRIVAGERNAAILNWYSAWEQCGTYDYGEASVHAFRREYLPKKYGSLDNLNKAWRQDFKSFDDVVPATYYDCVGDRKLTNDLALARAKASFLDFRDFNSKAYATHLGLKTRAIQENDPEKRNMTSAYSNNNLGSICWLKWRPLSF